jgi:hypothetical protein
MQVPGNPESGITTDAGDAVGEPNQTARSIRVQPRGCGYAATGFGLQRGKQKPVATGALADKTNGCLAQAALFVIIDHGLIGHIQYNVFPGPR